MENTKKLHDLPVGSQALKIQGTSIKQYTALTIQAILVISN